VGHGQLIADAGVAELTAGRSSLEEAFMALTADAVEYQATGYEGSPPWRSR
jgi:hypothetical protein